MPQRLTPREREILGWAAEGKTASETATILGISPRTIEWHLGKCRKKIDAINLPHAIAMAIRAGVVGMVGATGLCGFVAEYGYRLLRILDIVGPPGGVA